MKALLNLFIKVYSNTLGKWHMPFSHKKFNLNDYFKIEEKLKELNVPFAIGLVTTYGNGSNLGIKFSNWMSKDKRKKKSKKTHLFIYAAHLDGFKFRVAEQVGTGLQNSSLLEAIGQKDEVKIRIPDKRYIADPTATLATEYINNLLNIDKDTPINYDNKHVLDMDNTSDCSGLLWQALTYAFSELGLENLLETIDRLGMETFTPVDAEFSKLFTTIYDDGFDIKE